MTIAESIAQAIRWRLDVDEIEESRRNVDAQVERGFVFEPEEMPLVEAARAKIDADDSWADAFIGAITAYLSDSRRVGDSAKATSALRDRAAITFVDHLGVSVTVSRCSDESVLIVADRGVLWMLSALAATLASVWPIGGHRSVTTSVPLELRVEAAARRLLRNPQPLVRHRHAPSRYALQADLVFHAMTFAIAHEFGHVALGHTVNGRSSSFAGTEVAVPAGVTVEEFAADAAALRACLQESESEADELLVRLAGVRCLFTTLSTLERYAYAVPATSHPPADERWRRVAGALVRSGQREVTDRLDGLWHATRAGSTPARLPSPSDLVSRLRSDASLCQEILPENAVRSLAAADRWFTTPLEMHRRYLAEAHVDHGVELESAGRAIHDAVSAAVSSGGLSWRTLFDAIENRNQRLLPSKTAISVARTAYADCRP